MPTVVVIANPDAGRGHGAEAQRAAVRQLRLLGIDPVVSVAASADEARELTSAAIAQRPDALVLVGGDGTLLGVLDELRDSNIPLALIPAGTGNDLARALNIPFGSTDAAARAADLVIEGVPQLLDIGEAETAERTARFLTIAALGFDAKVAERTNRLRWPNGRLRYYLALVIELLRLRPMRFTLRIDGEPAIDAPGTLIAVGNTRSYGGGMPICVEADPRDGLLDVVRVAPIGRLRLLRLFPRLLKGTHLSLPQVTSQRASEVEVSAPDLVVYTDGERVGTGTVRIRTLPGALRILLPRTSAERPERDPR